MEISKWSLNEELTQEIQFETLHVGSNPTLSAKLKATFERSFLEGTQCSFLLKCQYVKRCI